MNTKRIILLAIALCLIYFPERNSSALNVFLGTLLAYFGYNAYLKKVKQDEAHEYIENMIAELNIKAAELAPYKMEPKVAEEQDLTPEEKKRLLSARAPFIMEKLFSSMHSTDDDSRFKL